MTKNLDIVTLEGQQWKRWRKFFNPGFSPAHMMALVPTIVKEVEVLCKIFSDHEKTGKMVRMKNLTDNYLMDVTGRLVLYVLNPAAMQHSY